MFITELKGIGDKTAALFNKLGVYEVTDLIEYFPRAYDVYRPPVCIDDIDGEGIYAVCGMVAKNAEVLKKGRLTVVSTYIKDEAGKLLAVTWFNMPYLKNVLKAGNRLIVRGHIKTHGRMYLMEQPVMYKLSEYDRLLHTMQPIYSLTKGITNNMITKAVTQAFDVVGDYEEYMPYEFIKDYQLISYNDAIRKVHFPLDMEEYIKARKRLVFDEFFLFLLGLKKLRGKTEGMKNENVIENDARTDAFIQELPYALTNAQQKVWEDIRHNMASDTVMNRLVQGDVGSGKTIVALLALMNTAFCGMQGAMMVPTEVLAKQQYDSICKMFEEHHIDIGVELLVGSMSAKEKKEAYARISAGESRIIVGTHALIQEKVEYQHLALVITDEQHRFGVRQREKLSEKGSVPHIMVMSATPIPRTLAVILYGDLDISVIDELPANRLPIKNCVVDESYRPKAYDFMKKEIGAGHQIYIICPLVEESENTEAENVMEYAEMLKQELTQCSIAYLHGKMKAAEKDEIMEAFARGETDILVSTTVIEVGVNVPNATVIMIENADRFGLAQLHQLRGRVGRGNAQSYCILVSGKKDKKTKERLEIMNRSNDGFFIAREDLRLRGPGDFFGVRQSGDMEFSLGDIYSDTDVLYEANEAVTRFIDEEYEVDDVCYDRINEKLKKYSDKLKRLNL